VEDSNGNDVGSLVSGAWVVAPPANVLREYTTGGSWSKPTDASFKGVWVFAAGGGGSGGAGTIVSAQVNLNGGSGGGGGSLVRLWIPEASLGATETYAIGAGAGGPASSAGDTGGATLFGLHVEAKGGTGGQVGANPNRATAAGGSSVLNTPIASGYSISGNSSGNGIRTAPVTEAGNAMESLAGAGGGGGGGRDTTTSGPGSNGGGCYSAGTLTAGGVAGTAGGGAGVAGVSDIYLDPFLGLVTSTIGMGTGGGGGGGNFGAGTAGGNGGAGGRAAGGGGGGSATTTRGAGGAGGNGFLLVYEVFAI